MQRVREHKTILLLDIPTHRRVLQQCYPCAQDAKYHTSVAAQSVMVLSCLSRAITEHLHNGDLRLTAGEPFPSQLDEASQKYFTRPELRIHPLIHSFTQSLTPSQGDMGLELYPCMHEARRQTGQQLITWLTSVAFLTRNRGVPVWFDWPDFSSLDVERSGGTFPQTVLFHNLNSVTKLSSISVSFSHHLILFFYKLCI